MARQQGFLMVSSLLFMLMMGWLTISLLQQVRIDLLMTGAHLTGVQQEHKLLQQLRLARDTPESHISSQLLDVVPCRRHPQDLKHCQLWFVELKASSARGEHLMRQTFLHELNPD